MKDQHLGQVRVYILPDDVGRASIGRQQSSLRKAMQLLIAQIDISKATWKGEWSEDTPVAHIDSSLDEKPKEDVSLFYLFNTLPSPKPDPEIVVNRYAREAMYRILDSDIEGLTTKMHVYQRRSAALMLQRETQPSQIIDPRLRSIVDQKGATWYIDLDASTCLREPRTYEAAKGGICAETMGLGKTLICLALILATRELSSQIPVEYSVGTVPKGKNRSLVDMIAATIGRNGTPWKSYFAALEAEGYDYSRCLNAVRENAGFYELPSPPPRRESSRNPVTIPPRKIWLTTATIVVVPTNLVQQWRHEIKKHTVGLKVLVMNSSKSILPPAKELAEYDLLLFSKPRFDREAKDGSDSQGRRRTTTYSVCRCPYIGSTRKRNCTCFKEEDAYRSPLKDLHFKRLITDEGHNFGNASSSSRTEAITVVDFLQLSSRWIVSGTPTQGLYGTEVGLSNSGDSSISNTPSQSDSDDIKPDLTGGISNRLMELPDSPDSASENPSEREQAFYMQERKDLEKLGNIATMYLKARPWANTYEENDVASWSQHVMQPRHGSKSHGNMECLKSTLEGMIIRHRPEDVSQDVVLPPLHQNVVYLDGSIQDRLSLNMFAIMIVVNAVTSERKDNDYFFHPRQRKSLQLLVSNMRQASFFWSNFATDHVQNTINVGKTFLEKGEVPVTPEDEALLRNAISVGENFIANNISKAARKWHEMPIYIQNECPEDIRAAWALDEDPRNPTLMGAGMAHTAQKIVQQQLWKQDPMDGMVEAGKKAFADAYSMQHPPLSARPLKPSAKDPKRAKKIAEQAPVALAGGVSLGDGPTPRKRPRTSSVGAAKINLTEESVSIPDKTGASDRGESGQQISTAMPKSALRKSKREDVVGTLDPTSPLASATIVSTSSAKLSYLMDRIIVQHITEKIIIFYEADNIAFYIAQALECLHIQHLIYAKTLSSDRRSQYVVTFNQSEDFRVLLMDVSQAAFGLDLSSASRVYFVNPVFSPQVEAQAVKRAHRIGQTKPVFVETLILRGSIEEVIVERRKDMSTEEHNKCKSILDDQTMYDWIRNVRFLPLPTDEVPGPDQMAKLEIPQPVFGRGTTRLGEQDPDAGLVADGLSPDAKSKKRKNASFADNEPEAGPSKKAKGKRKLASAIPEEDGYISTDDEEHEKEQEEPQVKTLSEAMRETMRARKLGRFHSTSSMLTSIAGPEPDDTSFQSTSSMLASIAGEEQLPAPSQFVFNMPASSIFSKFQISPGSSPELGSDSSREEDSQFPPIQRQRKSLSVFNGSSSIFNPIERSDFDITAAPSCASTSRSLGPDPQRQHFGALNGFSYAPLHQPTGHAYNPSQYGPSLGRPSSPLGAQSEGYGSLGQPSNSASLEDDGEIEYSTPRPKTKRQQTQYLGVKMPGGDFKLPPRNYTSSYDPVTSAPSSSGSPSPTSTAPTTPGSSIRLGISSGSSGGEVSTPTKAQRARLGANGANSLLIKMKLGRAARKMEEVEKKSDEWRAEMEASGAKLGKRGWERTGPAPSARADRVAAKKDNVKKQANNRTNRKRERDEAFGGGGDDDEDTFVS